MNISTLIPSLFLSGLLLLALPATGQPDWKRRGELPPGHQKHRYERHRTPPGHESARTYRRPRYRGQHRELQHRELQHRELGRGAAGEVMNVNIASRGRLYRHNGARYYCYEGHYYRPAHRGYVLVQPPVGLQVYDLPPYAQQVVVNRRVFYEADGIWFRRLRTYYPDDPAFVVVHRPI